MGKFIESLRQKAEQRTFAAQKQAEEILKEGEKQRSEEERIAMERTQNRLPWEKSRDQFNESGLFTILQNVIKLRGALGRYVDPQNFDELLYWKWDVGRPYYRAELHIQETRKYHETFYQGGHSERITTTYIAIKTDQDGTISFQGSMFSGRIGRLKIPVVAKVPRAKWENNTDALENALGKVYPHPRVSNKDEIIGSPFFDHLAELGGGLDSLGQALRDYKPK